MPRRGIWSETIKRQIAYEQDYKCATCYNKLPSTWCADHIIPLHLNGDNTISNCQILCPNCHAQKTQMEMIRWNEYQNELRTGRSRYFNPTTTSYISKS